ncbi:hypothetical protein AAK964_14650 [Tissierella praeacuta]|uniref:hypothetical protein n=1 Tax=Tissierella praeacuta TaxID=43131 RepID=UPI0035167712
MKRKKTLVIIGILFIIILSVVLYMKSQSIHVRSKDGEWEVYYRREFQDPKGTWSGYLYYRGKNNVTKASAIFMVNEKLYAGNDVFDKNINYTPSFLEKLAFGGRPRIVFSFATFGSKLTSSDKCELILKWKVNENIYEDTFVFE